MYKRQHQSLYQNLHISDNNRFFPGLGAIDFHAVLRLLQGLRYQGTITIEGRVRANWADDVSFSCDYLEQDVYKRQLVYTVCYQLVRDVHTAEDLAQDAFLSAWLHRDDCRPDARKAWLCRIAVNLSLIHISCVAGHDQHACRHPAHVLPDHRPGTNGDGRSHTLKIRIKKEALVTRASFFLCKLCQHNGYEHQNAAQQLLHGKQMCIRDSPFILFEKRRRAAVPMTSSGR